MDTVKNNIALIQVIRKELRTDSRLLASVLGHRHRTILESIDKYETQLKELGEIPFQTELGSVREQGGRSITRYALLNEDQSYFILTLMRNNEQVAKAKLSLVKAFRDARERLREKQSVEWKRAREEGKLSRKAQTDVIEEFVEYATAQGSSNARHYYSNITKGTYKALYLLERSAEIKNLRERLSVMQLNQLATAEGIARKAIAEYMDLGTHYKDIYKVAIDRVITLADLLGKQLPGNDNVQRLR